MDYKRVVCRRLAAVALCATALTEGGASVIGQDRAGPVLSPRNASYTIAATLDHDRRIVTGRERIAWRNISAQATTEIRLHLFWNAWRDTRSTWLRERRLASTTPIRSDAFGAIDITAITLARIANVESRENRGLTPVLTPVALPLNLTTQLRFIAPDDGNPDDRTVATVPIPPVQPGGEIELDVEWTAKIPRPFARTGYIDDYYFIAQWFPKIGVLEDTGWNTHQFHSSTEFYADFGIYDVSLTLPRRFVVGASGRSVGRTDNADGTTTHRFRGEDINDFAWTASPDYQVVTRTFEHPTLPDTEMRLLVLPEHAGLTDRYFASTAAALKYFGEWFGPYPWGYVTIVDPAYQSLADGMEYPTFYTGRSRWIAPSRVSVPEATTAHEAGHQFWYATVATNEFEHAWMDEGLTTFATARTLEAAYPTFRLERRFFGGFIPWVFDDIPLPRATDGNRLTGYRDAAEADVQSHASYTYWPGTATAVTYNKTALWLHTLERHLGWPVLQTIMATYFERWKFKHPKPDDFFRIANEVSGQDWTWFFDQVHRSSNAFDYGVQEIRSDREPDGTYRTTVVARRYGEATFPVDVVTTFADGHTVTERWDGRDRRAMYVYTRPAAATQAVVDPQRVLLLDVNYTNNGRSLAPRTRDAGLKWSLTWMVWLQDLMLTYGFFV
jgi:hypothetical protein